MNFYSIQFQTLFSIFYLFWLSFYSLFVNLYTKLIQSFYPTVFLFSSWQHQRLICYDGHRWRCCARQIRETFYRLRESDMAIEILTVSDQFSHSARRKAVCTFLRSFAGSGDTHFLFPTAHQPTEKPFGLANAHLPTRVLKHWRSVMASTKWCM